MKIAPLHFISIIAFILLISLACNLTSSANPMAATQIEQPAATVETSIPLSPISPSSPTGTNPPAAPPAVKSPLRWGKYSCMNDCISEEFLEGFKVIGGVPPLRWLYNQISVSVDREGKVTAGGAGFTIETNWKAGESCTHGEYQFYQSSSTGSYDVASNILTLEMTGDESFGLGGYGVHCAVSSLSGQTTKTFTFAVNTDGNLVLCKSGETGAACLANPMALLTP
jgi:hypothetical protein